MLVFALLGSMGTGKTSIYNSLIKQGFIGIKETTTRPMRSGEECSNQYIFVDNQLFDLSCRQKLMIGQSSFTVADGQVYKYGFHINSLPIDIENNCVVQVNYQSLQDLKDFYGNDLITIKLVRDEQDIIASVRKRGDNASEIKRRIEKDFSLYSSIPTDYTFNNLTIEECLSSINKIRR